MVKFLFTLINQPGDLYERILTKVTSTVRMHFCTQGRGQDSPIQTDLTWLMRCFFVAKKKTLICLMQLFTNTLLANGNELNLNLFCHQAFWHFHK